MGIELYLDDPALCADGKALLLPGHCEERKRLDDLPEELALQKSCGWETTVVLKRCDLRAAYEFIYGDAYCYDNGFQKYELPFAADAEGEEPIRLIGFWD